MRILVADDDAHIREVVCFALAQAGYTTTEARDGAEALTRFESEAPDLVVLDVLMPEEDGLGVCRRIRQTSAVPILFLSSRSEEIDRVLGLELGGDDYLSKPFSPRELVARVKAILRRVAEPPRTEDETAALRFGELVVDRARHRVFWGEAEVTLTTTELSLLASLLRHPGRVYSREELVERAWGLGHHITDRTVDSHVRRIRAKFAEVGGEPVETVYGAGYRLREP